MAVMERGVVEARDELSALLTNAENGQWTIVRDRSGVRSVVAEWHRVVELLGARPKQPASWWAMSEARASFPALHREGQQAPVGITRRNHEFVLTGADQLQRWLAARYRFTTEVIYESEGGVALWVPELALFGRGATYEQAREDLLTEVLDYLEEWDEELHTAPNHKAREGWVRRLQLVAHDPAALAAALLEG